MRLMKLDEKTKVHPRDLGLHEQAVLMHDTKNEIMGSVLRVMYGWIYEFNNGVTFVQDVETLPGWPA